MMSEKQKQQQKEKQKCIKYLINKSEKEASISKCSSSSIKEIKIPLYIHHKSRKYTITGINHGAFMCLKIKSIKFPSNSKIQLIDNYSLCGTSIESITIPTHVTKIGISAFSSCTKLKIVKFNDDSKLQVIEDNSFFGTKIKYIKIPSQVTMIGSDAFSHCKRLKRIEFENDSKLQSIGKGAFASS